MCFLTRPGRRQSGAALTCKASESEQQPLEPWFLQPLKPVKRFWTAHAIHVFLVSIGTNPLMLSRISHGTT